jgi:hypothetical protein
MIGAAADGSDESYAYDALHYANFNSGALPDSKIVCPGSGEPAE